MHTMGRCVCVARAAGSSARSRRAAGSFVKKRRQAPIRGLTRAAVSFCEQRAAGSFAFCRKVGRLLGSTEHMPRHCRSTMQVQGGRLQNPQRVQRASALWNGTLRGLTRAAGSFALSHKGAVSFVHKGQQVPLRCVGRAAGSFAQWKQTPSHCKRCSMTCAPRVMRLSLSEMTFPRDPDMKWHAHVFRKI